MGGQNHPGAVAQDNAKCNSIICKVGRDTSGPTSSVKMKAIEKYNEMVDSLRQCRGKS